MLDLEFLWIMKGISRTFKEPVAFFGEIREKEVNFTIPVVFLVLTGICLGLVSYSRLPVVSSESVEALTTTQVDQIRNIWLIKVESFMYPIWLLLFWVLFVIAFSVSLQWNNGWGDFKGIFNCTSFLIYYNFAVAFIWVILTWFLPGLVFIAYILQVIAAILNYIMLIEIARGAGELILSHGIFAATIPAFFFTLLWFSYHNILRLFIMPA